MKFLSAFSTRKNLWLFSIIFFEGYIVLASELLAIRLLVPFVGSGTEIISIIISAVLLPLAVGYHRGGSVYQRELQKARRKNRPPRKLQRILGDNILIAMLILTFGLSYFFLEVFFIILTKSGIDSTLLKTALYCGIFMVTPVYLLGQTIPIVSNYFSKSSLSVATGSMLFFSTLGSFLGSVFSTLILMMTIGVNNTVIITIAMLFALVIIIRRKLAAEVIIAFVVFLVAIQMNRQGLYEKKNIVSNNAYSTIKIVNMKNEDARLMLMNQSASSKVGDGEYERFKYIAYIEDNFIYNYFGERPLNILVIGAGGFTLGLKDNTNHYDFVDIDPDLKNVSEKNFLHRELGNNKKFIASSARAFLAGSREKYDLIIVDAYTNFLTIPAECTTKEFFEAVKARLDQNGVVVANFITSASFEDRFSVRLYNTFNSVFPRFNKQVIDNYSPWEEEPQLRNNIFVYVNREIARDNAIYTDDLNTYSLDKY